MLYNHIKTENIEANKGPVDYGGWVDLWPKGTSDNNFLNYSANRTTRLLRQLSRTALVQATSDDYHLNHTHQLVQLLSALYIDSNQASSFAFLDAPVKPSFPNKAWWRTYDFVGKRILADVYRSFWRIGAFLKTKCVVARERQCRDNGRFRRWLCMRPPTPHCLFRGKVSHTAPTRSSICTRPSHTSSFICTRPGLTFETKMEKQLIADLSSQNVRNWIAGHKKLSFSLVDIDWVNFSF